MFTRKLAFLSSLELSSCRAAIHIGHNWSLQVGSVAAHVEALRMKEQGLRYLV